MIVANASSRILASFSVRSCAGGTSTALQIFPRASIPAFLSTTPQPSQWRFALRRHASFAIDSSSASKSHPKAGKPSSACEHGRMWCEQRRPSSPADQFSRIPLRFEQMQMQMR
jgi:hypothetical protein